jgi:hypothetical protein
VGNVGTVIGTDVVERHVDAATQATSLYRNVKAVYQGPGRSFLMRLKNQIFEVGFLLSPEEARHLKKELSFAVVVTPKPPFLADGRQKSAVTTYDYHDSFTFLVADIRCTLVTDASGLVYGGVPWR